MARGDDDPAHRRHPARRGRDRGRGTRARDGRRAAVRARPARPQPRRRLAPRRGHRRGDLASPSSARSSASRPTPLGERPRRHPALGDVADRSSRSSSSAGCCSTCSSGSPRRRPPVARPASSMPRRSAARDWLTIGDHRRRTGLDPLRRSNSIAVIPEGIRSVGALLAVRLPDRARHRHRAEVHRAVHAGPALWPHPRGRVPRCSRWSCRHHPVRFPQQSRYFLDQAIVILTYVMLGWGLNIVVGFAGLLDLGYVAFYAVGAYSFALLAIYFDLELLDLPAARRHPRRDLGHHPRLPGAASARRLPRDRDPRLRRDHPPRAASTGSDFTGGPNGIFATFRGRRSSASRSSAAKAASPTSSGSTISPLQRIIFLYYVILVLALITGLGRRRGSARLPVGRAWEALREDEIACRSLGINTTNTKLTAFAIGAMFARLRRLVLRHPPGLHLAGILQLARSPS